MAAGCAGGVAPAATTAVPFEARPLIIAHRGASGERPEHTLTAYRLAITQGADVIEPDLVLTKDGVLVARHENEISGTTDVATRGEFADRKARKSIDGETVEGWFTEDFTLAELKTLRCRERLPELRPANTAFDGQDTIPTFEEVIALAKGEGARLGRTIGIYPETKHPSYFEDLGLDFQPALLADLTRHGWNSREAPVFVQSFEVGNLKRLSRASDVRLIQLMAADGGPWDHREGRGWDYRLMASYRWMAGASHLYGVGPQKTMILPWGADERLQAATGLVQDAHRRGLKVHPWTVRRENVFLPADFRRLPAGGSEWRATVGDVEAEVAALLAAGVDGLFTDNIPEAVAARDAWLAQAASAA
jgi:glycerophosphoryl diester phosphodiesterase